MLFDLLFDLVHPLLDLVHALLFVLFFFQTTLYFPNYLAADLLAVLTLLYCVDEFGFQFAQSKVSELGLDFANHSVSLLRKSVDGVVINFFDGGCKVLQRKGVCEDNFFQPFKR